MKYFLAVSVLLAVAALGVSQIHPVPMPTRYLPSSSSARPPTPTRPFPPPRKGLLTTPASPVLQPYPPYQVEAYGKQPLYFQQINEGRYDDKLISDVYFSNQTNVNFGILGQREDNLIRENPFIEKFEVIRERCPPEFIDLFVRKVNHLRSRHQAQPLVYDAKLGREAQYKLTHKALNPDLLFDPPLPPMVASSKYFFEIRTRGVKDILINAESVVEKFYLTGAKQYRSYGHIPYKYESFFRMAAFTNLVWASSAKVGLACTTVQTGVDFPVRGINNQVTIEAYYNNHDQSQIADNVFPPGYFDFDVKATGIEKQTKQEQKINKKSIFDIAAGK